MLTKRYHAEARHIELSYTHYVPITTNGVIGFAGLSQIIDDGMVGRPSIPKDILSLRPSWQSLTARLSVWIHEGRPKDTPFSYHCMLLVREKLTGRSYEIESKVKSCGVDDLWLGTDNSFECDPRELRLDNKARLSDGLNELFFEAVLRRMHLSLRISVEKNLVWIEAVPKNHLTIQTVTTRYAKAGD